MRFGCPRVAARHKRAYLGKENPFAEHKDVAGDTRQGSRSAAGSDWMDHKAEHRSILLIRPLHPLRLTTFGREIAGLLWSGQGGFSAKRGFILPILYHKPEFDPTRRVILHCASGGRSALAVHALRELGYANVAHLDGGFKAWQAAGKPVAGGA